MPAGTQEADPIDLTQGDEEPQREIYGSYGLWDNVLSCLMQADRGPRWQNRRPSLLLRIRFSRGGCPLP